MKPLLSGTRLSQIAGSGVRHPGFQVLVWDPNFNTIGQVALGTQPHAGTDLTAYVERVELTENIGFENENDPSVPQAAFTFRRHPNTGLTIRRGLFEDGVIVRVYAGDKRIAPEGWVPIFTGTFRGRPGDDAGTPSSLTEGLTAVAYGREERFLNQTVTTESFPAGTDLGDMAAAIAVRHMGLSQSEVLFGSFAFQARHVQNQIVEEPVLSALWHCMFPVGKKPKFDALGRLTAVDASLDKPAARVFTASMIERLTAAPNDVEVNNSVVVRGLSDKLEKAIQESQLLTTVQATTGYFDREFVETVFYSDDRTRRAQDTFLVQKRKIRWADASWTPVDEFHGVLSVDTRYLARIRTILFATYLATTLLVALLDFLIQTGSVFITIATLGTAEAFRLALQILSIVTLVGFLWATTFIGRGVYEIHGRPFEFVFRELTARSRLQGLDLDEVREAEFRNDFLSRMSEVKAAARERLRREIVKDQVFDIAAEDDLGVEPDDVVEDHDGSRYYITQVRRTLGNGVPATMVLQGLKVFDAETALVDAAVGAGAEA